MILRAYLHKGFEKEVYVTEVAVALTVMAIGVLYWTYKPDLERLSSSISGYDNRREEIKENEEQAKEHRITLNDDFIRARDICFNQGLSWTETFQRFRDSKHYLQHLYTGHVQIDGALRSMILIDLEGKKHMMEERQKGLLQDSVLLFQKYFNELQGQIRRKARNLDGICEDCISLKDEKSKKFQAMKKRLDSFTMPF